MSRRPEKLTPDDLPTHGFHKSSRCGRIRWKGREHWTGPWRNRRGGWKPTKEAEAEYRRLCAEILEYGAPLPRKVAPTGDADPAPGLLVSGLVRSYKAYVEQHYRAATVARVRATMKVLLEAAADVPAASFGRRDLIAVRTAMIAGREAKGKAKARKPWSRTTTNAAIAQIRAMFEWAAEAELVPDEVPARLKLLRHLQPGKTTAAEPRVVQPADEAAIEKALPEMTSVVATMVQLQMLSGMRPNEVCQMRRCDLDLSGPVWVYTPEHHKMEHKGLSRKVALGAPDPEDVEKCKALLAPFLVDRPADAYLFSPAESEAERFAKLREARDRAPGGTSSGGKRRARGRRRRRPPGQRFDTNSYRRSIAGACERAGVEAVAPNRLRHFWATRTVKTHSIEVVQYGLGHASPTMSATYAKVDPIQKLIGLTKLAS